MRRNGTMRVGAKLHGWVVAMLVLQSLAFQQQPHLADQRMLHLQRTTCSSSLPPRRGPWISPPLQARCIWLRMNRGRTNEGDEELDNFFSMAEALLRQNKNQLDSLSFGREWKLMFPDKDLDKLRRAKGATVAQILSSSERFEVSNKPNSVLKIFRLKESQKPKSVERKASSRGYSFSVVKASPTQTAGGQGKSEVNATSSTNTAARASESALKLMDAWSQAATSATSSSPAEKEEKSLGLMQQVGNVTSAQFYNRLIRRYVESVAQGDREALFKALDVLADMRSKGVELNLLIFNSILAVCKKAAATDQTEAAVNAAFQILRDIKSLQLQPDLVTFNLLLETCSNAIDCGYAECFEDALSTFDMMQEYAIRPNIATYNMLLFSCSRAAQDSGPSIISKCFDILDLMQADGMLPDISVFNAMIDACAKSARGDDGVSVGLQILERMASNNIEPDVITYNSLINVCAMSAAEGDTNAFVNAREILNMMLKAGVR
eukprot:765047-Hanusia_phi.AAC.3